MKIYIEGMKCEGCVKTVTNVLSSIDNVNVIDVDLESGIATIETDQDVENIIKEKLGNVGFQVKNIK